MKQLLFILFQHCVPQHLLSRLVGKLAASEALWLKDLLIRRFIARFGVDMSEAAEPDPARYASFNAFFTRELRDGVRPQDNDARAVLSPADGAISALGIIDGDRVFQAKGHSFSLTTLLGGDLARAAPFIGGSFATVYLSPKDYHRVHAPLGATLREMVYVPGKLYSVNQTTAEGIDNLFARNERAVCLFDTAAGPMAVVLVGAMIVAAIDTVWAGQVAPATGGVDVSDYRSAKPTVRIDRGGELGRFRLGSTAIILFTPGAVSWERTLVTGSEVRMGQRIGVVVR
jgi:phosphatidylserine decarboxylase